jgi:hypothetical protein
MAFAAIIYNLWLPAGRRYARKAERLAQPPVIVNARGLGCPILRLGRHRYFRRPSTSNLAAVCSLNLFSSLGMSDVLSGLADAVCANRSARFASRQRGTHLPSRVLLPVIYQQWRTCNWELAGTERLCKIAHIGQVGRFKRGRVGMASMAADYCAGEAIVGDLGSSGLPHGFGG